MGLLILIFSRFDKLAEHCMSFLRFAGTLMRYLTPDWVGWRDESVCVCSPEKPMPDGGYYITDNPNPKPRHMDHIGGMEQEKLNHMDIFLNVKNNYEI